MTPHKPPTRELPLHSRTPVLPVLPVLPVWPRGAVLLAAGRGRSKHGIRLEPVSGFEPLTCRLQEVWPSAPCALPAQIVQPGARMALSTLGFSGWPFHATFHATSLVGVCPEALRGYLRGGFGQTLCWALELPVLRPTLVR